MNDIDLYEVFKKMLDQNTVNSLKKYIILPDHDSYKVFEKYNIKRTKIGFKVTSNTSDKTHIFSSAKYALAYCTMDNRNKVVESQRICFLDSTLASIKISLKLYEKYSKQTKLQDKKHIYHNKILEGKLKQKLILKELDDFSLKAKQYHLSSIPKSSYK